MATMEVKETNLERLRKATTEGDVAVVRALLESGHLDVNAGDANWFGKTPLHEAASRGHSQVVELLLKGGADPNAAMENGSTPLHNASLRGHLQIAELLLTASADPNKAAKDGGTPLHYAAQYGYLQVMEMLVTASQDPDVANKKTGETALHYACKFAQSDSARVLLALNADIHAEDSKGLEPLHSCIRPHRRGLGLTSKTLQTLQVLVSFGATWDVQCDEMVTRGEAWNEASAFKLCMSMWSQELANGLLLTNIPLEVVKRGVFSTQAYIDDLKKSPEIILRRKICLVGSSCAGKTSLAKSIISKQPQLVHLDDRTIGIDHFPLRFSESSTASGDKSRIHEVTFWDFAGQDAYQVAHSLFFSPRTLYLVCVDLGAFAIAYMQAVIFADYDFQETKLLDEFVEDSVMRWVRLIVARQPDAEFVFIATKEDTLADNQVTEELLRQSLLAKLKQVNTTVQQMKEPKEKVEDDSSMSLTGWLKKAGTTVQWMAEQLKTENQKNPTHVSEGQKGDTITDPTVVFVSCASLASTQDTRTKIEQLVIKSDYSFEMTETYTRVLKEIVQIREAAKVKGIATRISQLFAPVDSLPAVLDIEPGLCRSILQTLHDLGDVLWYEDLEVALFWNTVILEPLLLIDFIRPVFDHKNTSQILPHADLKSKQYWVALDARDDRSERKQMKAVKQVLQAFHLVYPDNEDGVMEWDSGLIVPAFWQIKTPAAWKFLGDILRINRTRTREGEAVRLHWEYHFECGLPSPLFDHLVVIVASVSPYCKFDAGPDWIMYKEEEIAACRIMVSRDPTSMHRTILVEAVVADIASPEQVASLWESFRQVTGAFVRVLRENPGLRVSSFAWTDKEYKIAMKKLLWSPPDPASSRKWMPPVEIWKWFQRLETEQGRNRTIEADWHGL